MLHLIFNLTASKLTRFCVSLCSFKTGSFSNHFDPVIAHRKKASRDLSPWCLFCCLLGLYSILTYYLTLYLTSCIEVHSFLRVALLLQKGFTFEPFRSCYRPPEEDITRLRLRGVFFVALSGSKHSYLLSHFVFNPLHRGLHVFALVNVFWTQNLKN